MSSADAVVAGLLMKVGTVRLYTTLDADIGKSIELTDKFDPTNVKTATFDVSKNLLFDGLKAFTSYNVKMYGTDGETVESNQDFMLNGFEYKEINVGLNVNSFAGIKAIVDQGLEGDLLEIGHEFSEDDNVGDDGGRWVVVAKDMDEDYRHSVFLGRKYVLPNGIQDLMSNLYNNHYNNVFTKHLNDSYYENLPDAIKNTITPRNLETWNKNTIGSQGSITEGKHIQKVWNLSLSEALGHITGNARQADGTSTITVWSVTAEYSKYPQFPYYAESQENAMAYEKISGIRRSLYLRSGLEPTVFMSGGYITQAFYGNTGLLGYYGGNGTSVGCYMRPHMMIASGPIE